jgi:hypothetical protein
MVSSRVACAGVCAAVLSLFVLTAPDTGHAQTQAEVAIGAADIGGRVVDPNGPEAGVWVIAETTDLPRKFAKIVVTNDQGCFVIPELPANYKIRSRGYGLVDSDKQDARPGQMIDSTANSAPNEAAAAEYYPSVYWYSLLKIPPVAQHQGRSDRELR